ncbi:unnamed protein product [Effrenium voratum]|nr:unnamed protein product [Effrenium voratum]|mmetsp:Transcript_94432/g.224969  ORF Transcript_94432/g.224969 Transcript_94432/m.224969 type:complete len:480 (+) Transcript_94432:108-1547(+)
MRHYESGKWGFSLIFGIYGSVFPYAFAMAAVNAALTLAVGVFLEGMDDVNQDADTTNTVAGLMAGFSSVMMFILTFRSDIAYERWWEGGTLLQKTRGEWFNSYSSLVAFSSPKPELQRQVMEFHHLLARLMSLLFCCALQQVSPDKDRAFEILDMQGVEKESLMYLESTKDKVEIILQWIQRSIVLRMTDGILPVAPPVLSRAFQELSRGIVNLQNARKIADFPFPYPYAQVSMIMLLLHWGVMPIWCSMLLSKFMAAATSFAVIFFLWCLNFIALHLEAPFGDAPNDLPMDQMILDWNNSLCTLLSSRAQRPPAFDYDPVNHARWYTSMSTALPSLEDGEDWCHKATVESQLSNPKMRKRQSGGVVRNRSKESNRSSLDDQVQIKRQSTNESVATVLEHGEPGRIGMRTAAQGRLEIKPISPNVPAAPPPPKPEGPEASGGAAEIGPVSPNIPAAPSNADPEGLPVSGINSEIINQSC